jgi:DNA-binding NtrC family response regulator
LNKNKYLSVPFNLALTIRAHPPSTAGAVIPDVYAPRFGASVDREVLMPQEYLGDVYLGADCVPVPEIPPSESQALSPHQIVPMLIGSTIEAIERELVLQTLARCHGNRTRAARVLGLSVRTMRNKIRQYATDGVDIPAHS